MPLPVGQGAHRIAEVVGLQGSAEALLLLGRVRLLALLALLAHHILTHTGEAVHSHRVVRAKTLALLLTLGTSQRCGIQLGI